MRRGRWAPGNEDIREFPKGALKMVSPGSVYTLSSFSSTLKYTMQLDPTHQNENQREAVPRLAFRTDFYQYNVRYTSHSKWYAQWGQMLSEAIIYPVWVRTVIG